MPVAENSIYFEPAHWHPALASLIQRRAEMAVHYMSLKCKGSEDQAEQSKVDHVGRPVQGIISVSKPI